MLYENETLEDLEYKDLRIIQNKNGYRFTSDAIILANLVKITGKRTVIELGGGSGVISILLATKTTAEKVVCVELQERLADMARRSVEYNGLENKINVVNEDMKTAVNVYNGFDVAVCNPPYEKVIKESEKAEEKDICKTEVAITLREVAECAAKALKFGGYFYVIVKAKRLAELIFLLKSVRLEPKELLPILPKADKEIDTVVVTAKKGGAEGLSFHKPLVVYDDNGEMTERVRRMYNK